VSTARGETPAPGASGASGASAPPRPLPPIASCAVAVDVALMTVRGGRLELLLVEPEPTDLAGRLALPGRRVREDESLDDTVHRALDELAGVRAPVALLEQLRTYGDPDRDPRGRVVSVAHLALIPAPIAPAPDAERSARFVDVATLVDLPDDRFAYDHARIVADAIERARSRLEYTALATAFVTEPFTLADLRRVYEAVWGVPLDPANFRRKVASTPGFVVPVDARTAPGPEGGRPARLYRRGGATLLHPAMLRERAARAA
jgi:8-oxo-dGTP diphosphatase